MSLNKYNKKRNFDNTNEPKGKTKKTSKKKLVFCVQHHLARKDHYDFRLEYNGELLSWAIPKGPSYNPKDKRLAIHVENHPISYKDFEGVIPKSEYGGGTVMLFDIGNYEMLESFSKTFKKGYLKFRLYGKRLKGDWALITIKNDNWILIKEKDNVKVFDDISKIKKSIKTGRTMNEIKQSIDKDKLEVIITHPEKVLYKSPKVTKQDVIEYYKKVYKRMFPYLNDRLISTVRAPSGVNGEKFFKKHFSENKYLIKKMVSNENYYYINSLNGLINEVQLNSIEFHIWGCNASDIMHPNIMVFDLDPDELLPISKVRDCVKDLKKILDKLKLKAFLKTSGGKGYHVVVPFFEKISWPKFRQVAENITNIMVSKYPEKYTNNIRLKNRKGKILIDYFRNIKGSTFIAPYSLRIKNKPTVSMPIRWSELDKIKPNEITLKEAIKRLKRKDPWAHFFDNNTD